MGPVAQLVDRDEPYNHVYCMLVLLREICTVSWLNGKEIPMGRGPIFFVVVFFEKKTQKK